MQELAYSIHLGSDKNRSKLGKRVAKNNLSDTASLSNNAIQNSQQLSKVNKHNLRDYDKKFPIKDSKGMIRGKLGAVSYREKGTTDKNELDDYYEAISDLVLYKTEQTEDEEENSED